MYYLKWSVYIGYLFLVYVIGFIGIYKYSMLELFGVKMGKSKNVFYFTVFLV